VTIRNTLLGGRAAGLSTALGVAVGQTIWAVATSAGIVALLVASEPLFTAVKYAGAAFLVFLGLQALREAIRPSAWPAAERPGRGQARRLGRRAAFAQGVVSDLGNPKMAVFFASLLPQFVPAEGATFGALLLLGIVFAVMTLLWLALYAAAIAKAGDVLHRPTIRRSIEAVAGTVLVGLGIRIAADQR
jgi:threonine/homoserine/homoserine lactone efflux protein